mgnify:CR=1 FL=1
MEDITGIGSILPITTGLPEILKLCTLWPRNCIQLLHCQYAGSNGIRFSLCFHHQQYRKQPGFYCKQHLEATRLSGKKDLVRQRVYAYRRDLNRIEGILLTLYSTFQRQKAVRPKLSFELKGSEF